jgi:hypothetical protein
MRVGSIVIAVWLVIGGFAAIQRGYFDDSGTSCTKVGTTVLSVVAGPLNYMGVNPKASCKAPKPSE